MTAGPHPNPAELRAFVLGMLPENRQSAIEKHVLNCAECGKAMEQVPDDTIVCGLRAEGTVVLGVENERLRVPRELADHPRYRILKTLGRGGMGIVLKAEHKLMKRTVALKVINHRFVKEPQMVERFRQEVRAAAQLDHPNIVRAHDAEQAGDTHFLVMEFVDGESLDRLVQKEGPLSVKKTCQIIVQAARGLDHASKMGMVHRDIKPQNLMLNKDGVLKVLDFGLARFGREVPLASATASAPATQGETVVGSRLTQVGAILGTPDYIAPEQAMDASKADIRADIYSLGCTMYFLLAGRPPFPGGTVLEKLMAHSDSTPTPVSELRTGLPTELVEMVERMMAKEPDERYQTPAKVVSALMNLLRAQNPAKKAPAAPASQGSTVVTQPMTQSNGRTASPLRATWLIGGIVMVILLAGGLTWLLPQFGKVEQDSNKNAVSKTNVATPKVLFIIPHKDFYYEDVGPARKVLEDAGVEVVFASSQRSPAISWEAKETIQPDLLLKEVNADDYEAIVFSGQVNSSSEYAEGAPQGQEAEQLVRKMLSRKKFVASICTGVHALAGAGVLAGRRIAVSKYLPMDFASHYDATKVDEPVVVSGGIITGRDPEDSAAFAREIVRRVKASERK